jgi:hypothetical protein
VLDFKLFQKQLGEKELLRATVSTPQSILVSVPPFAKDPFKHDIALVLEDLKSPRKDADDRIDKVGYSARMRLRDP